MIIVAKSANAFTYKYGFLAQVLIFVMYVMVMFVKEILFKVLDTLNDLLMKLDKLLGGNRTTEQPTEFDPSAYDAYIKDEPVYDEEEEKIEEEIEKEPTEEKVNSEARYE